MNLKAIAPALTLAACDQWGYTCDDTAAADCVGEECPTLTPEEDVLATPYAKEIFLTVKAKTANVLAGELSCTAIDQNGDGLTISPMESDEGDSTVRLLTDHFPTAKLEDANFRLILACDKTDPCTVAVSFLDKEGEESPNHTVSIDDVVY